MVKLDIFHRETDIVGEGKSRRFQKYIDLHIPKRFEEKFYFLLGYSHRNLEICIDLDYWLIWYINHELLLFM